MSDIIVDCVDKQYPSFAVYDRIRLLKVIKTQQNRFAEEYEKIMEVKIEQGKEHLAKRLKFYEAAVPLIPLYNAFVRERLQEILNGTEEEKARFRVIKVASPRAKELKKKLENIGIDDLSKYDYVHTDDETKTLIYPHRGILNEYLNPTFTDYCGEKGNPYFGPEITVDSFYSWKEGGDNYLPVEEFLQTRYIVALTRQEGTLTSNNFGGLSSISKCIYEKTKVKLEIKTQKDLDEWIGRMKERLDRIKFLSSLDEA